MPVGCIVTLKFVYCCSRRFFFAFMYTVAGKRTAFGPV